MNKRKVFFCITVTIFLNACTNKFFEKSSDLDPKPPAVAENIDSDLVYRPGVRKEDSQNGKPSNTRIKEEQAQDKLRVLNQEKLANDPVKKPETKAVLVKHTERQQEKIPKEQRKEQRKEQQSQVKQAKDTSDIKLATTKDTIDKPKNLETHGAPVKAAHRETPKSLPQPIAKKHSNTDLSLPKQVLQKETRPEPKPTRGSLRGQVVLLAENMQALSAEGVIILLEPNNKTGHEPVPKSRKTVDMSNKQYNPHQIIVSLQDDIEFKNNDPVKHNVFSSTGSNSFDLGTYGSGKSANTRFTETGIAKVYCNIHPDMVLFVGISEFGYATLVDQQGNFSIQDLPAGAYQLTVWSPRGDKTRSVQITADSTLEQRIVLNTENYRYTPHKNKHGKEYGNASLFDDEFY